MFLNNSIIQYNSDRLDLIAASEEQQKNAAKPTILNGLNLRQLKRIQSSAQKETSKKLE